MKQIKGFTLLELIFVIVLLGIFSAMLVTKPLDFYPDRITYSVAELLHSRLVLIQQLAETQNQYVKITCDKKNQKINFTYYPSEETIPNDPDGTVLSTFSLSKVDEDENHQSKEFKKVGLNSGVNLKRNLTFYLTPHGEWFREENGKPKNSNKEIEIVLERKINRNYSRYKIVSEGKILKIKR